MILFFLSLDRKNFEVFIYRQAVYFDIVHPGVGWTVPEPVEHQFDLGFRALDYSLDFIAGSVADITFEAGQVPGVRQSGPAETDAGDAAFDDHMISCFGFAHDLLNVYFKKYRTMVRTHHIT